MGAWCLVLCSLVVVSLGPYSRGWAPASTTGRYSIPLLLIAGPLDDYAKSDVSWPISDISNTPVSDNFRRE